MPFQNEMIAEPTSAATGLSTVPGLTDATDARPRQLHVVDPTAGALRDGAVVLDHPSVARLEPARSPRTAGSRRVLHSVFEGTGWVATRVVTDVLMSVLALAVAIGGVGALLHLPADDAPLALMPPLTLLALFFRGLYRTRLRALILDNVVRLVGAVSVASMASATLAILAGHGIAKGGHFVETWACTVIAVGCGRCVLALGQRQARRLADAGKPVLIVGAGLVGAGVARRLQNHPEYGLSPIGFVDDEPAVETEDCPLLGRLEDLGAVLDRTGAREVIIAFTTSSDTRISAAMHECQDRSVRVSVVPRMFDWINDRVTYEAVGGLPLLAFNAVQPRGTWFAVKHALDACVAAAMLAIIGPVLLTLALAVRLSSPGPIMFRQRRVGRNGELFDILKFRTMRIDDADGADFVPTIGSAPGGVEGVDRRTRVGRFMRRFSLDELPQLINVLKGDMSLVGPRPERPEFVEVFSTNIDRYGDRHRVRCGITGWAQVHGLRGQTSLRDRIEYDNYYISHWSLGLDLKILFLTVFTLFKPAE